MILQDMKDVGKQEGLNSLEQVQEKSVHFATFECFVLHEPVWLISCKV